MIHWLSADGGVVFELTCSSLAAVGDTVRAILTHLPLAKGAHLTIHVEAYS